MTWLPYRLLIAFVLIHSSLAAQPGYKTFVLQEDNKPIQINTLFKRSNGYLLAGTNNGLYKFDGERFSRIHFENNEYNDTVTAIFEDVSKKLWVGFG